MRTYLKIKICSLAAESKIIRREEKRWLSRRKPGSQPHDIYFGLYRHRIRDVRPESRSAGLAYGFLRGREYRQLEQKCHEWPNWKRVEQLILKYGPGDERDLKQRFAEWKSVT